MLLIISKSKRIAKSISETFRYMSILSYGATPAEGLSEVSELYRAALIVGPEEFPDIIDYVRRLKSYKSDLPVFAAVGDEPKSYYPDVFDGVYLKPSFTPALAQKIITHANENNRARIGDYRLAGINASSGLLGVRYFFDRVDLTKTEAMILRYLIRSYPLPVNAQSILKYCFKASRRPEAASIRTHISVINKKFEKLSDKKMIGLIPHKGYRILTPDPNLLIK